MQREPGPLMVLATDITATSYWMTVQEILSLSGSSGSVPSGTYGDNMHIPIITISSLGTITGITTTSIANKVMMYVSLNVA
jgi:hypothetical protein